MQISKEQERKREKLVEKYKEKARKGNFYAVQKLEEFGVCADNLAFIGDNGGDAPYGV